jgi:hypothetical protein
LKNPFIKKVNRTLGCGYLDESDNIFKSDGITVKLNENNEKAVTCLCSHLTAIGV